MERGKRMINNYSSNKYNIEISNVIIMLIKVFERLRSIIIEKEV